MIRFWPRIGGRVAIVSATLPQPLITLLNEAIARRRLARAGELAVNWHRHQNATVEPIE